MVDALKERLTAEAEPLWRADEALCRRAAALMRGEFRLGPVTPVGGSPGAVTRAGELSALGERVVPRLLELLYCERAPDPIAEAALVTALVRLRDRRATPVLAALLDAGEPRSLRLAAAEALGRMGDPAAVPPLCGALLDGAAPLDVRRAGALSLGLLHARGAASALASVVDDPQAPSDLRGDAAVALGLAGGDDAVEPLAHRLPIERDPSVIERLAAALAETRSPAALPLLRRLEASHADAGVRGAAASAAALLAERLGHA